jgi:hypothetical protein
MLTFVAKRSERQRSSKRAATLIESDYELVRRPELIRTGVACACALFARRRNVRVLESIGVSVRKLSLSSARAAASCRSRALVP